MYAEKIFFTQNLDIKYIFFIPSSVLNIFVSNNRLQQKHRVLIRQVAGEVIGGEC